MDSFMNPQKSQRRAAENPDKREWGFLESEKNLIFAVCVDKLEVLAEIKLIRF